MKHSTIQCISLLLLLAFLLSLASCGGKTPPADSAVGVVPQTTGEDTQHGNEPEPEPAKPFLPVLRFVAASDVHLHDEGGALMQDLRLADLYDTAYKYCDGQTDYSALDGVFFAGDITQTGQPAALHRFFNIVENKTRTGTFSRAVMGNHEYYWAGSSDHVLDFLTESGYSSDDAHFVLNGYHFIMLSTSGNGFSQKKRDWLATELQAAANADPTGRKPIFVFQHQNNKNTVYGSAVSWGITDLHEILGSFPQVVDFSGHSHFPINDPRSIWQGTYTALNTGALTGLEMDLAGVYDENVRATDDVGGYVVGSSSYPSRSQYYIIEVNAENAIRVLRYDLNTHHFLSDPVLIPSVGNISEFIYTGQRKVTSQAPAFAENALAEIKKLSTRYIKITFPQAYCPDFVQNYRCDLYIGNDHMQTVYRLADTFLYEPPKSLELCYTALTPGTAYTIKIFPINAFCKEGKPLCLNFTTPSEAGSGTSALSPDVFSIQFLENGKAINTVSDTALTSSGTPGTVYDNSLNRYVGVFDGTNNFQYADFGAFYPCIEESVSFEAYLKLDGLPTEQEGIWNPFSNQEAGGLGFEYKTNGKMYFYVNVNGTYYSAKGTVSSGSYVHIVGTFDGAYIKIYLNGSLLETITAVGTIKMPLLTYLCIGADTGNGLKGSSHMHGTIAVANVYSRALTDTQVASLYNQFQ